MLWVAAICNAMNLLDNMDGLSAGVAAIASGFFTVLAVWHGQIWVSLVGAVLLGATLGFLRFNWNPATIFMGDAGSLLLGFLLAVRPNTSVALWVARPSWKTLLGAALFLGLSVAIFPSWPGDWLAALPADYSTWMPPIFRPFGALLLVAALRWNLPEGRLILATAFLPQTALPYELVALALIPAGGREMAVYLAGTWIAVADAAGALQIVGGAGWTMTGWPVTLLAVYFPMLYLVLRRPGSKGGPWMGKERRRPHRLPDDVLKVEVKVEDQGQFSATITHLPTQQSVTESASTRRDALRKAHDKLAAVLARTSRLVTKKPAQSK